MLRKLLMGLTISTILLFTAACGNESETVEYPANYELFIIKEGGGFQTRMKVNEADLIDEHTVHVITTTGGELTLKGHYIEIVPIK